MANITYRDSIAPHILDGAPGDPTNRGVMIVNPDCPPNADSAASKEDNLDITDSQNQIAHVESDDILASRPISIATVQTSNDLNKSVERSPLLQLTDQTNLLPLRKVLLVFTGLALCVTITSLDSVVVSTALPTITNWFNAGSVVSWVPAAYVLASTTCQPLYGRFSDIFGRKLTLCVAMAVYTLGCLVAGFSTSMTILVISRAFAGAGGGGIQGIAQVIVSDIVSLRERGKYQGIIAGAITFGYAVGPLIGGVLAQKVSWRWCFWVNPPIALFTICFFAFVLPLKPVEGNLKEKFLAIDYLGTILIVTGSVLILLPLNWGGVTFPWNSPIIIGLLCSGILVAALFCLWEWKGARLPIVPMYIFDHITVRGVYITMFINGFLSYFSMYYLPQFFQVALGYSPIQSGIFLLPLLISQTFANWMTGLLTSATGKYRASLYAGFAVWAIGCGCMSLVGASRSKPLLVICTLLSGMGAGQTLPTGIIAVQASVPRKDMSVVMAVRNYVRLLGGTFALAVGSVLINNSLRRNLSSLSLSSSAIAAIIGNPAILGPNTPASELAPLGMTPQMASFVLSHGYMAGFRLVFLLNACLATIAAIVSFFMIQHNDLTRGDEEKLKAEALAALREVEKTQGSDQQV